MSGKQDRERRREERLAAESAVAGEDRRRKLLQLGAAAAFLAVVAVAVLIVVNSSSSDGGDASNVKDAALVEDELADIPQSALTIGDPDAPVEVREFADLQCPYCKQFAENELPQVLEGAVARGEAKISYNNFIVIGEESETAGAAALAAGAQGRGWNFIELFYRNQGREASGYVTEEFLTSIAEEAGVEDIARWNEDRKSAKFTAEVKKTSEEAVSLGFTGTPSFGIEGPASGGFETLEITSAEELEDAIEAAS